VAIERRSIADPVSAQKFFIEVAGEPVDQVVLPECAPVWQPGTKDLFSAVFLGGGWLLSALHPVQKNGDYHVALPVGSVTDLLPVNIFRVVDVHFRPGANDVDLCLLELNGAPAPTPFVTPPTLAGAADIGVGSKVKLCGFGSDDCNQAQGAGVKRTSLELPVVDPVALHLPVDPAIGFAADDLGPTPVTCPSDSGGGAYASAGGVLKLAGIIRATVHNAGGKPYTQCIRILPALDWIRNTTHLPLP
jgi:hypothetical protein